MTPEQIQKTMRMYHLTELLRDAKSAFQLARSEGNRHEMQRYLDDAKRIKEEHDQLRMELDMLQEKKEKGKKNRCSGLWCFNKDYSDKEGRRTRKVRMSKKSKKSKKRMSRNSRKMRN